MVTGLRTTRLTEVRSTLLSSSNTRTTRLGTSSTCTTCLGSSSTGTTCLGRCLHCSQPTSESLHSGGNSTGAPNTSPCSALSLHLTVGCCTWRGCAIADQSWRTHRLQRHLYAKHGGSQKHTHLAYSGWHFVCAVFLKSILRLTASKI